ncbi:MAG: hypothetical protein AVO35_09700 [Candidatus Aegiribacteria sp. MLS_C]|nr:MAG: hypothetical protein AVO35_09700 [Candidatus Aegiribacteria sp. MLS_C]
MKNKKFMNWLAILLSVIGAINWGIFGILGKDLISGILALGWDLSRVIYIIVGIAGVWALIFVLPKTNK